MPNRACPSTTPMITVMNTSESLVLGTAEGTPTFSSVVHVPLSSHTAARPSRDALRSKANQQTNASGRHFVSDPAGTSRRYGSTATPAQSLKQALRGRSAVRAPPADNAQASSSSAHPSVIAYDDLGEREWIRESGGHAIRRAFHWFERCGGVSFRVVVRARRTLRCSSEFIEIRTPTATRFRSQLRRSAPARRPEGRAAPLTWPSTRR